MAALDSTPISSLPSSGGNERNNQPVQPSYRQPPEPERMGKTVRTHTAPVYEPYDAHQHPNTTFADRLNPINSRDGAQPPGYDGGREGGGREGGGGGKQHELPPRDVVRPQPTRLDPAVVAGYIPPAPLGSGYSDEYVYRHQQNANRDIGDYNARKHRMARINEVIDTMQIPVILAILFFVMNMDRVNLFLVRTLTPFGLFNDMGAYNTTGLAVKSALFGAVYWATMNVIDLLSSL